MSFLFIGVLPAASHSANGFWLYSLAVFIQHHEFPGCYLVAVNLAETLFRLCEVARTDVRAMAIEQME